MLQNGIKVREEKVKKREGESVKFDKERGKREKFLENRI